MADAAVSDAAAVVYGAVITAGTLATDGGYTCTPRGQCKDACANTLGHGFVTCGSINGSCVPLGTCQDTCTQFLGDHHFVRCWEGASQTALSASVAVTSFQQILDIVIRLPGTVELYSCTNCTSAGARDAFVHGMAFALQIPVNAVTISEIIDEDRRRRLQGLILSVEFVTIKFHVVASRDVTSLLVDQAFPLRFSQGTSNAGIFLPGLDQNQRQDVTITTSVRLAVVTAAPVEWLMSAQSALRSTLKNTTSLATSLRDASVINVTLHPLGAIGAVNSTLSDYVLPIDCTGIHGGPLLTDACGVCGGDGSSCNDCAGVPYGAKIADRCAVCDTDPMNDCRPDCSGVWGGDKEMNPCGVCDGDISMCFAWGCDGVTGSGLVLDACGVCGGDGLQCLDCEGVAYGASRFDDCGVCDMDQANDCVGDCLGVWGGTKVLDRCGVCDGVGKSCSVSTHQIDVAMLIDGSASHEEISYGMLSSVATAASFSVTAGVLANPCYQILEPQLCVANLSNASVQFVHAFPDLFTNSCSDLPAYEIEQHTLDIKCSREASKCVPRKQCESPCTHLGEGFVMCVSDGCVPWDACLDPCAKVLGPQFEQCWPGSWQTASVLGDAIAISEEHVIEIDDVQPPQISVQLYRQKSRFLIRMAGLEEQYDNISASILDSPDVQVMQFVLGMAMHTATPIEDVSVLSITTAPGCADKDLVRCPFRPAY